MASPHIISAETPFLALECKSAFDLCSRKEKLYAHYFSQASWYGLPIVAQQVSEISPKLIKFFVELFSKNPVDSVKTVGVDQQSLKQFLIYAASVYSNGGNYLSFGDLKFVPELSQGTFKSIVSRLPTASEELSRQLDELIESIYSLDDSNASLAFPPKGTSSYYSANITKEDADTVDPFLVQKKQISLINSRLFKISDNDFELRVASVESGRTPLAFARDTKEEVPLDKFSPSSADVVRITVVTGDYSSSMARVVASLKAALPYVANDTQARMLNDYINSFTTGSIDAHKDSQREWVQDKGPAVETNIGFIESYRDPSGVRAEWEGLVAIVNKDQSKKYGKLVAGGPTFISRLPWGIDFEKDKFLAPDYTSLEVVTFAGSGIPLGINIPNYDDVRQHDGFKNVFLGNVGGAMNLNEKFTHILDADWEVVKSHFTVAMSVNVGLHELLGHGTGKLLAVDENGKFNFDKSKVKNPFGGADHKTESEITSWYQPGETWGSKFGPLSGPIEECRAEAVSLYLSLEHDVLALFDQTSPEDCANTIRVVWLNMVRSGLTALEFYTPETKQWRQAHARARFCILQVLLAGANPVAKITHDPSKDLLEIELDHSRLGTDGKAAIGDLLRHLNIYKAMADAKNGTEYFEGWTRVTEEFNSIRDTVMKLRKPRRQFIQAHTRLVNDDVELVTFDTSVEGAIKAMVSRHKEDIPFEV